MGFVGGIFGRLPGAVFVIAGLFIAASLMQAGNVSPDTIASAINVKVLLLIQLAIVLMPLGAAVAGLLAIVYLITHHHEHLIAAAISAGALIVIDIVWHAGVGTWVTAHLGGA